MFDITNLSVTDWIVIISAFFLLAGTGTFNFINGFLKTKNDKWKFDQDLDEKIFSKLKDYNSELEKKVADLEKQQGKHKSQIAELQGKNNLLIQILQGKDPDTSKFQEEGFKAMKQAQETHQLILSLASAVAAITTNSDEVKNAIVSIQGEIAGINGKINK